MTKTRDKQKHGEPILLFPKNLALLEGRKLDAINHQDVKDIFAKRKHLSTIHDKEAREGMGCVAISSLVMLMLSGWGIYTYWSNHNYYPVLILLFILIPSAFAIYRSILSMNYRPGKVNQIYQTWLKRGAVVEGEIVSISSYKTTTTIAYQFTDDSGKELQGSYLTHHMKIPRSVHQNNLDELKNKMIYILYADKKLHAPL